MKQFIASILPFGLVNWYLRKKKIAYIDKMISERKKNLTFFGDKRNKSQIKGNYINFGCGKNYQNGWINIDAENNGDINLFLTIDSNLPFGNNSVDGVFSEHFVEHIDLETGTHFFKESFRVLKKGGVLRVICPNLDYILQGVDNAKLDRLKKMFISVGDFNRMPNEISSAEIINWIFYGHGHKFIYNLESLSQLLTSIGFSRVYPSEFGKSIKNIAIERREDEAFYSLYVEAIK